MLGVEFLDLCVRFRPPRQPFPLLIALASLLSYVPIPKLFEDFLSLMARLVPGNGMELVDTIVSDVISHKHPHFLTLGLVFTIWTASSGLSAIIDGLDVVYRIRETRPVWKTRPLALGLTRQRQLFRIRDASLTSSSGAPIDESAELRLVLTSRLMWRNTFPLYGCSAPPPPCC